MHRPRPRDRCIYKLFTSPLELQRKAQTTKVYYTATRETGAARLRWLQLVDLRPDLPPLQAVGMHFLYPHHGRTGQL